MTKTLQILSYKQAKKLVQEEGIESRQHYNELADINQLPKGLPKDPRLFYGKSKDFHKKMVYNRSIVSYKEAQKFAKKMNVKSSHDWRKLSKQGKIPVNIPKSPQTVYTEWTNWGDFHGCKIGQGRRGNHVNYEEAKKILRKLNVRSSWEFKKLKEQHKLPKTLPSSPERTYKNKGWKGSGDFYGTNRLENWQDKSNFKTYKQAKKWARASPINSLTEYRLAKLPKDIPRNPWSFYEKEWEGYKIYLNPKPKYISFSEAKQVVRELEIYTPSQYDQEVDKKKLKLPYSPHKSYKEWKGWKDFLPSKIVSYEEVREFIKKSGIPTLQIYKEIGKKGYLPSCVPRHPESYFKIRKEWKGADHLVSWEKPFVSIQEAKELVKKLGIKTKRQYKQLAESGELPKNLPKNPDIVYTKLKSRWHT